MTKTEADGIWSRLARHREELATTSLRALFAADPARFERYAQSFDDLLLDLSKVKMTEETIALLAELAWASGVETRRDAMFAGDKINSTEGRAVLHIALRNRSDRAIETDGADVMPAVRETLGRALTFAEGIRSGTIAAADGGAFTDVVNIGIGGSDLGPAMTTRALRPYHNGPRLHFVSNVDGADIADTVALLDARRTLVIVASKTFTTAETMTNARSARAWIEAAVGADAASGHLAAISTAADKVAAFGIDLERMFGFWDWVGGRYSVWSAIGLPLMIAIGAANFAAFLDGAHEIDEHFRTEPIERNLPMLLGLVGVWHRNVCRYATRAILPYDQRLGRLPAYLQQLDMESNGKGVTFDGRPAPVSTGPIVWGEPGTNGQHAFFQFLHQGADVVPCEFLIAARGHEPALDHHQIMLIANCLAQSEALMNGRTTEEAAEALRRAGLAESDVVRLAPHKTFPGDRPSITIAYDRLDPRTLGRILALYEHRVFVEGAIWSINSFDQWGVELGKELAAQLLPMLSGTTSAAARDDSPRGLLAHIGARRRTV